MTKYLRIKSGEANFQLVERFDEVVDEKWKLNNTEQKFYMLTEETMEKYEKKTRGKFRG